MTLAEFGQRNTDERREFDDYPTPPSFTIALLRCEKFAGAIWEPAAGVGHMALALEQAGYEVTATDIQQGVDFFTVKETLEPNIVTNPPFKKALEFCEHALELRPRGKVAMLAKLTFLEGQKRHARLFSKKPPARVWVTTKRMLYAGTGGGMGAFAHAWFVWETTWAPGTYKTELGWFTPEGDRCIPQ